MRVLIFSEACFNDNIFPLYKTMKDKGIDVTCLINLSSLKIALFHIEERIQKQAIIKASEYKEFDIYKNYMDMNDLYFVNHDVDRKHPWREIVRTVDVANFIRKGRYDVIHTDMMMTRTYKYLYRIYGHKMLYVQHDPIEHTGMEWSKATRRMFNYIHRYVDHFVILNPMFYEEYCRCFQHAKEKVLINALGPLDCIKLFKDRNVNEKKHNILFFGRIVKYKGLDYLCEAMLKVHEIIPDATLTIAGSGKFHFEIDKYKKYPFFDIHNEYITTSDLANYLSASSISICYYTDATQSGGVLTSFSMDKPVIASDIEAMRQIVRNEYNGILVKPRDSDALAQAIIRLLTDDQLRDTIKSNIIYENKNGDRSWDKIVDKYISFYKTI